MSCRERSSRLGVTAMDWSTNTYLTSSDTLEYDIRVVLEQQQKGSPAKAQVYRRVVLSVHVMWTVIALEVA